MSEELLTLARKDGHLVALHSVATRGEQDAEPEHFTIGERRVDVPRDVAGAAARRALEAWRGLGDARLADAAGVATALTVLLETVPLGDGGSGATSAGQAWLCRASAWARVRAAAQARPGRVVRLLRAAGYAPHVARTLEARDPYVAYHHGALDAPGLQALPMRFRAFVLPLLRARPWSVVSRALALYWALDLAHDDVLLALAVRILVVAREHGLAWLALLAEEQPARRLTLGSVLLASGAASGDPRAVASGTLERLAHEEDAIHSDRLVFFLRGLANGVEPEHLVEGIRVVAHFAPCYRLGRDRRKPPRRHPRVPTRTGADLWNVLAHVASGFEANWTNWFAATLWKWSSETPERAAILRWPSLLAWPPVTTWALLRSLVYDPASGFTEAEQLSLTEGMLHRVPATHHAKAIDAFAAALEGTPRERVRLAAAAGLVVRVARPPYRADVDSASSAAVLLEAAGPALLDRLARLPERSLLLLDRALGDDHGVQPLRNGIESLGRQLRSLLFDALEAHPQPLLGAARQLGLLNEPRRRALLKRFRAHPVAQRRFVKRPLEDVCRTIEGLVRRGLPNPIPRRLRDHRDGRVCLSAPSLERHRQAIVRRLLPFRIALLRAMTLRELGGGVAAGSETERHALQMLGSIRIARRLLRRVLALPAADRRAFLEGHPANRAWLARHPRLDPSTWADGHAEAVRLPDGRHLRLAFELDPMEVLRMGTRVGSCLSVGGGCSATAVAVMADANKRLVVAHDERGRFVARQLVMVTEDDRLQFCSVYPEGASPAVQDAFERYDRALASLVGLPICTGGDYRVAAVLVRDFYDDGIWERLADEA